MKFKSELLTSASGSIGGATYLHGTGGLVRQAKPKPTNASSPQQRAVRASFQQIAIAWRNLLTDAQREAWIAYAKSTPITGKLGDPLTLSGSQMFNRCNTVRLAAGFLLVADGPSAPGNAEIGQTDAFLVPAPNIYVFTTDPPAAWREDDLGALVVQSTRLLPIARSSYRGRLRQMTVIPGSAASPPVVTFEMLNAFGQRADSATLGQPILFRLTASLPDGRISASKDHFVRAI